MAILTGPRILDSTCREYRTNMFGTQYYRDISTQRRIWITDNDGYSGAPPSSPTGYELQNTAEQIGFSDLDGTFEAVFEAVGAWTEVT